MLGMLSTYLVELHGTHECVVFFNQTPETIAKHLTTIGKGVARLTRTETYELMPDPSLPTWAFMVKADSPTIAKVRRVSTPQSSIVFSDEPEIEVALLKVWEAFPTAHEVVIHPVVGVCPGVEFKVTRAANKPQLKLVTGGPDCGESCSGKCPGGCDCDEPCDDCGQSGPRPGCGAHGPDAHEDSDAITIKADTILWLDPSESEEH